MVSDLTSSVVVFSCLLLFVISQLTQLHSMALETGIFLSQGIWLWRVRHVRKEAKKEGMTYDEYISIHPSKKLARSGPSAAVPDVEAGHTASRETLVETEKPMLTDSITDTGHGASKTTLVPTPGQSGGADETNSASNAMTTPIACPEKAMISDRRKFGTDPE
jgi:hypothetical protein